MAACTFFGHRECPETIKPALRGAIVRLIEKGVDTYYVGNQGAFDAHVRSVLRELVQRYPYIHYAVVLAYMPREGHASEEYSDSMLPEGIESVHPRYAINWRNNWMIHNAQYAITYITHTWGGASRYAAAARRRGIEVYNLV